MPIGTKASCQCARCRNACNNPGWFKPEEARLAIGAGHASRLMLDWYDIYDPNRNDDRIYVLAPASLGYEGRHAPDMNSGVGGWLQIMSGWTKGRCNFYKDGACEIHHTGFKPFQCCEALLCDDSRPRIGDDAADSNHAIAELWDTELGRSVVEEWERALQRRVRRKKKGRK